MRNILETERILTVSKNGIITLHRGDTFTIPISVNIGSGSHPEYYTLKGNDTLYFAVLEPGQKWENAIIKKVLTANNVIGDSEPLIHFYSEDTEHLVPGNYYYEVKLQRMAENCRDGFEHVDTIIPRTKFIIME